MKDSLAAAKDSVIVLKVEAKRKGRIIVLSDTVKVKTPKIDEFNKSEYQEFKAKKFFTLSSKDIEAFDIKLNGKKVKFEDKVVRDFKISKQTVNR